MLARVALDDGVALRVPDAEARIRQRLAGGNIQLCKLQLTGDGLFSRFPSSITTLFPVIRTSKISPDNTYPAGAFISRTSHIP